MSVLTAILDPSSRSVASLAWDSGHRLVLVACPGTNMLTSSIAARVQRMTLAIMVAIGDEEMNIILFL